MEMNEITLLVPGIGFGGIEMIFLSHQLQKKGLKTQIFFHNPWRKTIEEKAKMLNNFISSFEVDKIHYVGHSMGGLIIVKMFISYPNQHPGNIVTLGTPHNGCKSLKIALTIPGFKFLLGKCLISAVKLGKLPLPQNHRVGAIAGKLNFLLGYLLKLKTPNDTLVSVFETQHPDLKDSLAINATHASMLLSKKVAKNIVYFIKNGVFIHA
jgi:pimeloyl-ACP methyl ester carboxylesterase